MENKKIFRAALIGGVISSLLFSIPYLNFINCFCCIGIILGGITGLLYYKYSLKYATSISMAEAFTVGISSGILASFLSIFFEWIVLLVFGNWQLVLLEQSIRDLENSPQLYDLFQDIIFELEKSAEVGYNFKRIFAELVRNLLIFPIFCLAGSLISRYFLNKDKI